MVWASRLKRASPFIVAISAVGYVVYDRISQKYLLASWTTNFEPSVKWDYNWDRREPGSLIKPSKPNDSNDKVQNEKQTKNDDNLLKKYTPTASRHLILIRHGQYNTDGADDSQRYLTSLGEEQAMYAGERLKALNLPYTSLISSTMLRAIQTTDIIGKYLPDVLRSQTDVLREGAPIPPEPPIGHWRPEKHQFFEDGARIEGAFRKYFHRADPEQEKDSYEILVCHANVIRYFVCRALQLPPEAWLRISLNHASITLLTIRPSGRVVLRTLGDSGYMPVDKVSVA